MFTISDIVRDLLADKQQSAIVISLYLSVDYTPNNQ